MFVFADKDPEFLFRRESRRQGVMGMTDIVDMLA